MTIISDAVTSLANTLLTLSGESVTYASGVDSASLTMLRGQTEFDEYDITDYAFTGKTVDWLIETKDLILNVTAQLPALGDTITDAAGQIYTVVQPAGDRWYRYTDQTEKILRIHTVRTT